MVNALRAAAPWTTVTVDFDEWPPGPLLAHWRIVVCVSAPAGRPAGRTRSAPPRRAPRGQLTTANPRRACAPGRSSTYLPTALTLRSSRPYISPVGEDVLDFAARYCFDSD